MTDWELASENVPVIFPSARGDGQDEDPMPEVSAHLLMPKPEAEGRSPIQLDLRLF